MKIHKRKNNRQEIIKLKKELMGKRRKTGKIFERRSGPEITKSNT